jgi:hypothetical protein
LDFWIVITKQQSVPIERVVSRVWDCCLLPNGQWQWLVEAPRFAAALPRTMQGVIDVELAGPSGTLDTRILGEDEARRLGGNLRYSY